MNPLRASLVALTALAIACNAGPQQPPEPPEETATGTSPLEQTFSEAARSYQVPEGLLKAVAYVETRIDPKATQSTFGGWGTMHLVEREDWKALTRAAELTGQDKGRLMIDTTANIHGAAALLRALADDSFHKYPDLDPNDPGAFFYAVSMLPGFSSAPLAADYARDVFLVLENGFEVENQDGTVVQAPTYTNWRDFAPVATRQDAAKEYPAAYQWKASPNYSSGRTSYTYVLIHTVQGSYAGCISWFQNTSSNVSAHYVVRSSDGQVTQMVEHKDTAWHASCYNSKSVGIEHEGYVADPAKWYTEAMYASSAKLTRWIADRHAIPRTRTRIIGHVEVAAECNKNRHYDPGTGWNWTKYMNLVNGTSTTPTTGKITGVIYHSGSSSNPVSGATVTAGGKTVTTGTNGVYEFVLNPGTYTVNVTKSGYGSNSVSRTVTANNTVWGSMEINQSATTGTAKGIISDEGTNAAISGATVIVQGTSKTTTTSSSGLFTFALSPGTYTFVASKSGYNNATVTRTVTANADIWGSMKLSSTATPPPPDTTAPVVAISYPPNGEQLDHAQITLAGTVDDNKDTLTSVKVSVNGGTAATVSVASGKYSQVLKLNPGTNTVKVTATDVAGNAASKTHSVTFNAGVGGSVFTLSETGEEEVPLEGATVELIDPSNGSVVLSTTTNAQGAYVLTTTQVGREFMIAARLEGYMTHAETISLPDDHRLTVDLPLTWGVVMPTELGLSFLDPVHGTTVEAAEISVYGRVEGMLIASVQVNGVSADVMGGDGFVATVQLEVGDNEIVADAWGLDGETVSARMTVTRVATGGNTGGENNNGGGEGGIPPPPADTEKNVAPAQGGCAATGGLELLGLFALAPLFRRRRR